jgi:glycosyltransferase involved in cell wall biosynthesis
MIYGVMLVRNEADIIRANLLHHLASGIDHVLVVDNGSTDGTPPSWRSSPAPDAFT